MNSQTPMTNQAIKPNAQRNPLGLGAWDFIGQLCLRSILRKGGLDIGISLDGLPSQHTHFVRIQVN